ncbi:unnamed protein product [Rotaria sp. Silwood1]|nr:unnamed protein product [Rotaria sp. Silwood1]
MASTLKITRIETGETNESSLASLDFAHTNHFKISSTTQSSSTEVCDGENLAITLALYWVVYLIINAAIFAVAMYVLRRCFHNVKLPGGKYKMKEEHNVSRTNSRMSLVSRDKH